MGDYRTILIDPPWPYAAPPPRKDSRKGRRLRAGETMRPPYPMMAVEEIAALPVAALAAPESHLWLWATNRYLPDALAMCGQWGFRFFHLVTWVKPSGFGMWFVHRTQPLLFACRGKLALKNKCNPNVIFAPALSHSRKPEGSYELIERVSHGPKLELFARRTRPDWHVWGNEVESDVVLHAPPVPRPSLPLFGGTP